MRPDVSSATFLSGFPQKLQKCDDYTSCHSVPSTILERTVCFEVIDSFRSTRCIGFTRLRDIGAPPFNGDEILCSGQHS